MQNMLRELGFKPLSMVLVSLIILIPKSKMAVSFPDSWAPFTDKVSGVDYNPKAYLAFAESLQLVSVPTL